MIVALLAGLGGTASADAASGAALHVDDDQHGLVVLGMGSAVDAAWPLARAIYGEATLRPRTLDEAHARVLVGEAPGDAAPAELRDLADLRAAIHGDDGASRRLLESIALSLHVKGVVVVEAAAAPTARPSARVFVTTAQAYDPVRYEPDAPPTATWGPAAAAVTWGGAVEALRRGFADAPAVAAAAAAPSTPRAAVPLPTPAVPGGGTAISPIALHEVPAAAQVDKGKPTSRAFYQSPWFWAAAGAAVFAAGAVYLATRNDSTSDNIQLQVQVPK